MEEFSTNINPNELSSKRLARDLTWTLWVLKATIWPTKYETFEVCTFNCDLWNIRTEGTPSSRKRHRIDIPALRAHRSLRNDALTHDVLPKLGHPSSRKSVRIGESSSIKGPISDDKDLEMNGPCHSTGSLSSRACNHRAFDHRSSSRAVFC